LERRILNITKRPRSTRSAGYVVIYGRSRNGVSSSIVSRVLGPKTVATSIAHNMGPTNLVNERDAVHFPGIFKLPHDPRGEEGGIGEIVVRCEAHSRLARKAFRDGTTGRMSAVDSGMDDYGKQERTPD